MYVLSERMRKLVTQNSFYDMPDLFNDALSLKMHLEIFPLHESWIDIGRPEDYQQIEGKVF